MKRRWIEIGKDLLIVLLALAVLVLALLAVPTRTLASVPRLSAVLKPFAGFFGLSQAELTYTERAPAGLDAAQPLAISVRNSAGRYSAQYDFSALDGLYEALGSTLGQALETASSAEETTLQKLYAAISGTGVTLSYPAAIPSGVLASWLGAQTQEMGQSAAMYVLSVQESGEVRLYLRGEACWVCETGISGESLLQLLDGYRPDGSFFAMEDGSGVYAGLDPCVLVGGQTPQVPEASAQNPCDARFITALASELGFNPYGDASYTDAEGNAFFSESDAKLRISADGTLLLSADADTARFTAAAEDAGSRIELVRALLGQITAQLSTEARLYLSDFTQTEDGAQCAFDYVLSGASVLQKDGEHAVTARFSGSTLTELRMRLRSYSTQTQTVSLIPAAQAAAIVSQGSRLQVCYQDAADGALSAGWRRDS